VNNDGFHFISAKYVTTKAASPVVLKAGATDVSVKVRS
jgi:hypothetical protein